jgi:hypothetical protein
MTAPERLLVASREVSDALVDLLIHVVHKIGVRAEKRREGVAR